MAASTTPDGTTSFWAESALAPRYLPLLSDADADVCVVGGGLAGLSVAYFLAKEGKSVLVLEAQAVGAGQTGRTTAHLASAMDDRFVRLERLHGEKGSRLAYESHAAAIDAIERVVSQERVACDFERLDGYLFLGPGDDVQLLRDEMAAAHRSGFADTAFVEKVPIPGVDVGPALRFPRQGQFHPLKYLYGLAEAVTRNGGRIHVGTPVSRVDGGKPAEVRTEAGPVVHSRDVGGRNHPPSH